MNSSPTAPGTILSYLRQRFPLELFVPFSAYLILFAKGNFLFIPFDAISVILILCFLLTMRLLDDMQSVSADLHKPNRIYTDPRTHRTLNTSLGIATFVLILLTTMVDVKTAGLLLLFIAINYALYLMVQQPGWRTMIPLLKYPFIAALITTDIQLSHLALFFAFLTFDILDDPTHHLPRWTSVIMSLIAFAMILQSTSPERILIAGCMASVGVLITLIRAVYVPYAFLILLLIVRLINPLYEI